MNRLSISPKVQDILFGVPWTNQWFKTVGDRFNIYSGIADPTTSEVPQGQWVLHRNTVAGTTKLWTNWGGTLTSFSAGSTGVSSFSFTNANGITGTVTNSTTTPALSLSLGAITPTTVAATGDITTTGGKIGYATGAGGTVTQLTNKSTAVTLNKLTGQITLAAGLLTTGSNVKFVFTNSNIASTDLLIVNHVSGGTSGSYQAWSSNIGAGSADISVRNVSASGLNEQPVIGFAVIKAATS